MSRTNKKKQRENKKRVSNTHGSLRFRNPRKKLSLEKAKELGVVIPRTNEFGNTYHWFKRGRKACYETKMKYDPDGCRFYKNNKGEWLSTNMHPLPRWVKKRMKSMK